MQCPDCGAYYSEEDEFCGECGLRLSPETSGEPEKAEAEAETSPAEPGEQKDLADDLFEPALPGPTPVASKPKRGNLLPIVIGAGVALLLLCLVATGAIVWFFVRGEPVAIPLATLVIQEEPTAIPLATLVLQEEPSPTPPAATVKFEPGALLYEETFDGFGSDWSEFAEDDTAAGLADGGYQITIDQTYYMAWGNPEPAFDFGDLVIEVDVRQVEGPLDNNFGVIVRYFEDDDLSSYYWFQISGDGFYSVDLHLEDEWITLVGWESSAAIYTGLGVTNRIRVVCSGSQFSFYANGAHLLDLFDDTLDRGNIGVAAGSFEESGVVVRFDDLKVYELGE